MSKTQQVEALRQKMNNNFAIMVKELYLSEDK